MDTHGQVVIQGRANQGGARFCGKKNGPWKITPLMEAVSFKMMDTPENVDIMKMGKATGSWVCGHNRGEKTRKKVEKDRGHVLHFDGACFII